MNSWLVIKKGIAYSFVFACIFLFVQGCDLESEEGQVIEPKKEFVHEINSGPQPWTHDNFDTDKFTFALFSDLSGGERAGIFNVAVSQLNLLRPDMIINIGDLIDGEYDTLPQLIEQWDFFDQRADQARAPVFYVGGNHDLTSEEMGQVWDDRYGKKYYHFVYKNVLFLVLNTEDNTPERMQRNF